MNTIYVVIGFIILVAGHQSSWLFVGGIGFVVGSLIAERFSLVKSEIEWLVFSIVSGTIVGLLVAYIRKFMLAFAAFLCGGYIYYFLPHVLGLNPKEVNWMFVLLAACLCAIPVFIWGALPVILVSSLAGSILIVQNMKFGSVEPASMFIVLALFGVVAQFILWYYSNPDVET